MDKIRRFFHRNRKPKTKEPSITSPPSTAKRERLNDSSEAFHDVPPMKRARRSSLNGAIQQQAPRIDSHSDFTLETHAPAVAPKLDFKPIDANFSSVFDDLSLGEQQPRPRPAADVRNRSTSSTKAYSLPAHALFARGVKRFSEDTPNPETQLEDPFEAPTHFKTPTHRLMSLEDLLNKPLFGDQNSSKSDANGTAAISNGVDATVHERDTALEGHSTPNDNV